MKLIDADEFKEIILTYGKAGFGMLSIEKICELIDGQSTAYDVDKVVERLEKEIGDCMCEECDRHTDCDTCRAEKAVEIAKSGGIE